MSNPQWSTWPVAQLKRLGRIRYGASQPPPEVVDGVPFVRATNVDSGRIRSEELLRVSPDAVPSEERLSTRDVIVVRSGAYAADSARVPPAYEGAIAGYDMVWRSKGADAGFVGWCLLSRPVLGRQLSVLTARAAQPHLNAEELGSIQVPCPPLPTQRAIAGFLDSETAMIDALIEKKRRLLDLLDEKRTALITRAVTRGLDPDVPMKDSGVEWLGEIPAHWRITKIGLRFSVQLGKMLDQSEITGEELYPYLRVADVQWGMINVEDLPRMDFSPADRRRYALREGDLLVNEGGSYVGRSAIWEAKIADCFYQKALHRVRSRSDRDTTRFLYYVMRFATEHGVFVAGGNQTTIDHLTAEQLRRYGFAFPPRSEQEKIADLLDSWVAQMEQTATRVRDAISLLEEYRTALISAAVTGQIDVSEAAA